jgi:hypothetical protein
MDLQADTNVSEKHTVFILRADAPSVGTATSQCLNCFAFVIAVRLVIQAALCGDCYFVTELPDYVLLVDFLSQEVNICYGKIIDASFLSDL